MRTGSWYKRHATTLFPQVKNS